MKKLFLFLSVAICSYIATAQTKETPAQKPTGFHSSQVLEPLATATDFTVTFTDGSSGNLFTTCNAGNSVVLDFFYTTCSYCQMYAPTIDDAYVAHGSGNGNIKFWGIDYGDTDAEVNTYKTSYGVTNPCASGTQGGGNAVCSSYSVSLFPTYSVVCPDHTLSHDINYPPTTTGFNTFFSACGTTGIADESTPSKITFMYPLPAQEKLNVHIFSDKNSEIKIELFDIVGNNVYSFISSVDQGFYNAEIPVSGLTSGTYIIKLSQDNEVKDVQKVIVM